MKITQTEIAAFLGVLRETPQRIRSVSKGISAASLHAKSEKKPWSANDVLAHLRSCADVWGESIELMLTADRPKLGYIHPRQWVKRTGYLNLDFSSSLKAFSLQRKKLLRILKELPVEDWGRGALIQGRVHTVFSQVRRMALHEGEHCEQLEDLLK